MWLFARPEALLDDVATAVVEAGGRMRRRSAWLHAVSATLGRSALAAVRRSPLLTHIQPVAVFRAPPLPPARQQPVPRAPSPESHEARYGPSAMPLRQLNLFPLVHRGFRGKGIRIAILDTGFETQHPAFDSTNVIAERDFVQNDGVVRNEPSDTCATGTRSNASWHGTAVWSLLAANVPGSMIGIAPEAEYILAKTETVCFERRLEEDNYVAALEWADSLRARVASSSLGYFGFDDGFSYTTSQLNGDFAVTTRAADIAAARGITVVTAMGNDGLGPRRPSLGTPADGDSVIAVGAEDSLGNLAGFSSRGPTADGRIKPDLTAPGVSVWVVDTTPSGFGRHSGTSFSTPIIAGAGALLRQIHASVSAVDVRDALRRTGTDAANPNSDRGWGRPNTLVAATFPRGIVIASPTDTVLSSVTPTFGWSTPDVPPFGLPVRYRLTVSREDPTGPTTLVDTTLEQNSATLRTPQRPRTRLSFTLDATAADTATLRHRSAAPYVVPSWVTLLTLDDPAGAAIREPRPVLRWSSPSVLSPPGPFTYDVQVFRADNGEVEAQATGLDTTAFTPAADLELNTPYRWRVIARLGGDTARTESRGTFLVVDESVPTVTLLFQNFPNPFPNASIGQVTTCIWFDLATNGRVRLEVLDLRGHLVRRLIPSGALGEWRPAGRYGRPAVGASGRCDRDFEWDGRADNGLFVPRGVYIVKLETPDGTFFKRAVFLGAP